MSTSSKKKAQHLDANRGSLPHVKSNGGTVKPGEEWCKNNRIQGIWRLIHIPVHAHFPYSLFQAYRTLLLGTFVTGSKVYVPWEELRLAVRTPRGSWLLTSTASTALPMVCLGPRVKSKCPWELPSWKEMLCLTYNGIDPE